MSHNSPGFFESWREATPEDKGEMLFILGLTGIILSTLAAICAVVAALFWFIGFPKLGATVGLALFVFVLYHFRFIGWDR